MALKLHNEFVVNAPIDRTWETLLDLERVSRCLPGAVLEPDSTDGSYRGSMTIKLGPVTTEYRGVARLEEVDEDACVADFHVQGTETKGQGTASARIHNRLVPESEGTRVIVETQVSVTGRQAQFGRGIMQDVAGKLLSDFAERLEKEILAESGPQPISNGAAPTVPATKNAERAGSSPEPARPLPATAAEPLDLGSIATQALARRAAVVGGVAGVALLVLALARRRRSRVTLVIRW